MINYRVGVVVMDSLCYWSVAVVTFHHFPHFDLSEIIALATSYLPVTPAWPSWPVTSE